MISLGLPWVFGAALLGALIVVGLHLLSVRRPSELWLPTARFLPERDVRAVSRTRRPSDLFLLLLRVAVLLIAGFAVARPTWHPMTTSTVSLVVAAAGVGRDSAALVRAVGLTGSAARIEVIVPDDSMRIGQAAVVFPLAWRAAARAAAREAALDSFDLRVVVPFVPDDSSSLDGRSWHAWLDSWPGRVTIVAGAPNAENSRRVISRVDRGDALGVIDDDDPVLAAFAWYASRVVVGGARDSVTIHWPRDGQPRGWRAERRDTTASALTLGGRALLHRWHVAAMIDAMPPNARAIAWWSDGRVAALERRIGAVCERDVAIPMDATDAADDVLLSDAAKVLFDRLLAPCERREAVAMSTLSLHSTRVGPMAAASAFRTASDVMHDARRGSWFVPVLLTLALVLVLTESVVRARSVEAFP